MNTSPPESAQVRFQSDTGDAALLVNAIRCATLRARLDAVELDSVGLALTRHLITPRCAVSWLREIGLLDQVVEDKP
jgi:hypothetical protein